MTDMTCLAEGLVYPADSKITGINQNEIVVGPTGCGKSFSNAYSRLAHTYESSVVVPIAKKAIKEKFSAMFKARGYEVIDLDFAHPEKGTCGYDPLYYVHTEADAIDLAQRLIQSEAGEGNTNADPYWNNSAASVLAALIILAMLIAKQAGKTASFADVILLYRSLKLYEHGSFMSTNLDEIFDKADEIYPGNHGSELWRTFTGIAEKTASCIYSTANSVVDKFMTEDIARMSDCDTMVDFRKLGKRKTALFITTSPMNKSLHNYVNVLYGDLFRVLFEEAEKSEESCLDIPVHIICDDFACGSRIRDFEDYISIFRAAGVSVTLLLQSETQLVQMYGESAATTIINNCDTYVYMGGMDIRTCRNISERTDRPLSKVMELPLEQVMVFRRGQKYTQARRYQVLDDPLYAKAMGLTKKASDNKTA